MMIKNTDIAKELSLPPVKLHCSSKFYSILIFILVTYIYLSMYLTSFCVPSVLAEDAIKAALADYRLKQQDDQQEAARASS